jgi:glycosyltransferase involved in cell wall biosynthesis
VAPVAERRLRVAFLTVMPSPYTQDVFRAMERDGRIRPRVFYLEMAAPDTYWGKVPLPDYATVLPGFWVPFLGGRLHLNRGVIPAIAAEQPDAVVVSGYAGLTNQIVTGWLHRRRIPWVFHGEMPGMRRRIGMGSMLRWLAQRPAMRWADGIAAVGSRAAEAYQRMSGGRCPVANIPYGCDMTPFLAIGGREDRGKNRIRFLYCGQLIRRKGVDLLVDAFCRAAGVFPNIELVLIGQGPLGAALRARIPEAIQPRVQFAGFHPVAELPRLFAEADVFVLPSRHDGWGVVVNQAIAAGMPVICSDAVGAAADLVVENENGHLFPAGNGASLAEAIRFFTARPERIRSFGQRSREFAAQWTPERSVDRWYSLLSGIVGGDQQGESAGSTFGPQHEQR